MTRKTVQLEVYQSAIIRDVTYYLEEKESWIVHLTIHFETDSKTVEGNLAVQVKELLLVPINTTMSAIPDENGEFSFNISFQLPKVRNFGISLKKQKLKTLRCVLGKS